MEVLGFISQSVTARFKECKITVKRRRFLSSKMLKEDRRLSIGTAFRHIISCDQRIPKPLVGRTVFLNRLRMLLCQGRQLYLNIAPYLKCDCERFCDKTNVLARGVQRKITNLTGCTIEKLRCSP